MMEPKPLTPTRARFIRIEEAIRRRYCVYCRVPLFHPDVKITLEHRMPRFRGGNDARRNLLPLCRKCNGEKGHKTHEEYLSWLRTRPDSRLINGMIYAKKRYRYVPLRVIDARRKKAEEEFIIEFGRTWR